MAKRKSGVNRSQAIRDFLKENPTASAKEVVTKLGERQIAVKPGLVYMIKGRMSQSKSHKKKKAARVARATQNTGSKDPAALVLKVKELARTAGGFSNLKALVLALAD